MDILSQAQCGNNIAPKRFKRWVLNTLERNGHQLMYFHDELMLRTVLRIEPETDVGLYLGCVLTQSESQLHNGKKVKTITYDMEGLLKLSVDKYLDIVGKDNLKKVSAPSRRVSLVRTFLRLRDACSPRDWQLFSW